MHLCVYIHIRIHMYEVVYNHALTYRGQRLILGAFLYPSLPYSLKMKSPIECEAHQFG